jgi:hypothetical protein
MVSPRLFGPVLGSVPSRIFSQLSHLLLEELRRPVLDDKFAIGALG